MIEPGKRMWCTTLNSWVEVGCCSEDGYWEVKTDAGERWVVGDDTLHEEWC